MYDKSPKVIIDTKARSDPSMTGSVPSMIRSVPSMTGSVASIIDSQLIIDNNYK